LYCSPINSNIFAFKFSRDAQGGPVFTQVAQSSETSAFGVGAPVITTNNGQAGTGIVWATVSFIFL
jgi:hypothetical protein